MCLSHAPDPAGVAMDHYGIYIYHGVGSDHHSCHDRDISQEALRGVNGLY